MPSFKTNDAAQAAKATTLSPEGDYILQVTGYRTGPTKDGKNEKIDLKLLIEKTGSRLYETLTFSQDGLPRLVAFLTSCGITLHPNQEIEFDQTQMYEGKIFVELMGLRGWAKVYIDTYNGERKNKVRIWHPDKEKLPPARVDKPEEEGTPF